jgi:hypothetical protein
MSDRTFRLILDGKKGQLVKGSTPSSAAKKACKKLSAETGKTSFKFELQETTKDSKKKVYGPYKGSFVKDKIKVKMVGGTPGQTNSNLLPVITTDYIVSNTYSRFPTSAPNTHHGLPTATKVLNKMKTDASRIESVKRKENKNRNLGRRTNRQTKSNLGNNPYIPFAPKSTTGLTYHNTNISLIYPNGKTEQIKKSQLTHIKNNQYAYENLDVFNVNNTYRIIPRQPTGRYIEEVN